MKKVKKKFISPIGNIYFSIITDVEMSFIDYYLNSIVLIKKKKRKKERLLLYSTIIESDREHKEIANIYRKFINEFIFFSNANTKSKQKYFAWCK